MADTKKIYASGEGKIEMSFDGTTWSEVVDATSFSITIDGKTESWTPFNGDGWTKNYMVSKGMKISIDKKYQPTNDLDKKLVELALTKSAYDHNNMKLRFTLPKFLEASQTAAQLVMDVVVNVKEVLSKGSEDIAPLSIECDVNGKPTYIEEA